MQNLKKVVLVAFCVCGAILLIQLKYTKHYDDLVAKYYSSSQDDAESRPLQTEIIKKTKQRDQIRIFCYISTAPQYLETRAIAVNNTWARLCDKYFFITSILHLENNVIFSNRTIEMYDPLPILQVAGMKEEKYQTITEKVYGTYKHIYAKYPDYDWYMKADDDTFVFMDNLRSFLSKQDPQGIYTFGYNYKIGVPGGYHSGGAGIAFGNRAMNSIGAALTQNYSYCPNTGIDDKDLNECLRKLGFQMGNSLDDKGRERFHPIYTMFHFRNELGMLKEFAMNPLRGGADCCADETTSFHYVSPEQMYVFQDLWEKFKAEKGLPFNFTELLVTVSKMKEFA